MEEKTWNINMGGLYFDLVKRGLKTIEGRLLKDKFMFMKKGDTIKINEIIGGGIKVVIIDVKVYDSFKSMILNEGLDRCLPGIEKIETGVEIYRKFYPEADEKRYGVVAFRIKLL